MNKIAEENLVNQQKESQVKLEFKHLAPYFPYGLIMCEEVPRTNDKLETVINHDKGEFLSYLGTSEPYIVWRCIYQHSKKVWFRETPINQLGKKIKPILMPLSDLTKEHTWKGETAPYWWFVSEEDSPDYNLLMKFKEGELFPRELSYGLIDYLIENHFDIFGLIEKGLAIDINTLEK